MLDELQEHVESIDMANGEFLIINVKYMVSMCYICLQFAFYLSLTVFL